MTQCTDLFCWWYHLAHANQQYTTCHQAGAWLLQEKGPKAKLILQVRDENHLIQIDDRAQREGKFLSALTPCKRSILGITLEAGCWCFQLQSNVTLIAGTSAAVRARRTSVHNWDIYVREEHSCRGYATILKVRKSHPASTHP